MVATGRQPFPGETIADVVARSGAEPRRPFAWLELVALQLWEESAHRAAFAEADAAGDVLGRRDRRVFEDAGSPDGWPRGAVDRLEWARSLEIGAAVSYAVRVGF